MTVRGGGTDERRGDVWESACREVYIDCWGRDLWRCVVIFFFNDTATTEIYTLSLHDALPI